MVLELGLTEDLEFKPFLCNLHICFPHSVYLLICSFLVVSLNLLFFVYVLLFTRRYEVAREGQFAVLCLCLLPTCRWEVAFEG